MPTHIPLLPSLSPIGSPQTQQRPATPTGPAGMASSTAVYFVLVLTVGQLMLGSAGGSTTEQLMPGSAGPSAMTGGASALLQQEFALLDFGSCSNDCKSCLLDSFKPCFDAMFCFNPISLLPCVVNKFSIIQECLKRT